MVLGLQKVFHWSEYSAVLFLAVASMCLVCKSCGAVGVYLASDGLNQCSFAVITDNRCDFGNSDLQTEGDTERSSI